tara:strand:- start:528 stop:689 length:162 start_codon:yes stop_codon:yes gene_type:complete
MIKLNKGAIPRLTQEIYFTCGSGGSKKVNRELTLKEFDKKIVELTKTMEIKCI